MCWLILSKYRGKNNTKKEMQTNRLTSKCFRAREKHKNRAAGKKYRASVSCEPVCNTRLGTEIYAELPLPLWLVTLGTIPGSHP
jgi:hypothetical protein